MTAVKQIIYIVKWNSKLSSTVLLVLVLLLSQSQDCVSMGWYSMGRQVDQRRSCGETRGQAIPSAADH